MHAITPFVALHAMASANAPEPLPDRPADTGILQVLVDSQEGLEALQMGPTGPAVERVAAVGNLGEGDEALLVDVEFTAQLLRKSTLV